MRYKLIESARALISAANKADDESFNYCLQKLAGEGHESADPEIGHALLTLCDAIVLIRRAGGKTVQ